MIIDDTTWIISIGFSQDCSVKYILRTSDKSFKHFRENEAQYTIVRKYRVYHTIF